MQQKLVIIAAGGTGSRLNANLPKQYMLLANRPVLMHTIEAFVGIVDRVLIAIHPEMVEYWKSLCADYNFNIPHSLVIGGTTRFQSVQNALNYLQDNEVNFEESSIAVHDAARPLVDPVLILESFAQVAKGNNTALAIKSTNAIRLGTLTSSSAVDRNLVWQMQTPQTFQAKVLSEAYRQEESPLFTDDCSVVEKLGYPISLIESTPKNIKLTFPEDFEIAQLYLNR